MKRSVFDLLRRGFDNAIANWPVTAIRIAEMIVMIALTLGAIVAIVVPIFVSIGINIGEVSSPDQFEELFGTLATRWLLLFWIVLGISVLLLLWMLVHSFVEAGGARVFVDGDRIAGPLMAGPRSRYRVFSMERFLAGAKDGWWTVFWIYNIVWGIGMLLMLVPLLPTLAGILLLRENEGAAAITGCLGLVATVLLMIPIVVVSAVWCNRAIIDWATRRSGARGAIAAAWRSIRTDFGRHVLTALAIFVVSFAISMFFSSFSMFATFAGAAGGNDGVVMAMTFPLRMLISLVNSAVSTLIASWFSATYAAVATDPQQ